MKRPRIALLRGPYLGPFETQNYEPLLESFDIRGYILRQNPFDLDGCRFPVVVCDFPDARLFGGRSLINAWRTRILGQRYPMAGVNRIVRESDIVHTFEGWYSYTRQAARACERYGVPLVVTHWDTLPYKGSVDLKTRQEIARSYRAASCILATSNAARQALLQEKVPEEKIRIQSMGVDVERFSSAEPDPQLLQRLHLDASDFVFLFIGRLTAEKGIRELMYAFKALRRRPGSDNAKLLLVGSGPEGEWIRASAESWRLEKEVVLAPPVPYGEIHQWHRLGSVFVFPSVPSASVQEQFGYALVEAMSTGRPIITTRNGGIPDIVADAGCVIAPGDVDALFKAMAALKENTGLCRRLGEGARRRAVEKFSTRVVSQNLKRLYTELCPP